MAGVVLLKRTLVSLCRQIFFRQVPRLWSSWNHIIITCSCILLISNIVVFSKGCHSVFWFGEPIGPGREKHGHVITFPKHHFMNDQFSGKFHPVIENLMSNVVPLTVHFVWCDQKFFQFQNYLSVLSAYKFLLPVEIIFHYKSEPEIDNVAYYQFYQDLLRDLPVFFSKKLEDTKICSSDSSIKLPHVANLLNKYGGIYMDVNVLLSQSLNHLRKTPFSYFAEDENVLLMLMARHHVSSDKSTEDVISNSNALSCATPGTYYLSNASVFCVHVKGEMFPVDIFELKTDFGQLARWIGYGTKSLLIPQPHNTSVIPKIAHYVWLGSHTFSFFSYLSLLSSLYILNADSVYIHGDEYPKGEYWDRVKANRRVKFIFRERPTTVFGQVIGAQLSHASDFIRVDVLLRYGGIYLDWDALWVNTFPEHLRKYDFVACADWPRTGNYPDVINMGVIAASKESVFLQFFLESFRHYVDNHWSYNAVHMPYKVYEKHPDQLFHYRHLQVICYHFKCHPVWVNGYKDENVNHVTTAKFDWRKDTLVIHWTHPDPPEFDNEESLNAGHGMFSQIGKFILEQAALKSY